MIKNIKLVLMYFVMILFIIWENLIFKLVYENKCEFYILVNWKVIVILYGLFYIL